LPRIPAGDSVLESTGAPAGAQGGSVAISIETRGSTCVLSPRGRLVLGGGDVELRDAVRAQLGMGFQQFVLDLCQVTYMDSAGLGETIATLKRVRESDGDVKIAGLHDRVKNLFVLTRLETVFDVHPDVAGAIKAFDDEE
jgi:anti-sigma B factor antagonist